MPNKDSALAIPSWVALDEVSLRFTATPDIEGAMTLASVLTQFRQATGFYIGDFLNQAEVTFGEAASQVSTIFGEYEYGTLANYKSVCSRVIPATRRVFPSMGHCDAVKALDDSEQVRWLTIARDEELSVAELRRRIAGKEDAEDTFSDKAKKIAKKVDDLYVEAPNEDAMQYLATAAEALREAAKIVVIDE